MDMKKIKIDNVIYDVVNSKNYNSSIYPANKTAVYIDDIDKVLPVRAKHDKRIGAVIYDTVTLIHYPDLDYGIVSLVDHSLDKYDKSNIIDFNNVSNINELMAKQQAVTNLEIMQNPENILVLNISEEDSPTMVGFKTAINTKGIDLDNGYIDRLPDRNNDRRRMTKSDISLKKLIICCKATDINAELVLRDASPTVPNPIGKVIRVNLIEGNVEVEDAKNN